MIAIKTMLTAAAILAVPSAAFAFPPAGPGSYLDEVARDLTASAQNLEYILQYTAPGSEAYNDAETLYLAAEHFQEEVELGPEDLDVDFNAIEQTLDDLRGHFTSCSEYTRFPQVRSAWFRVEESNIRLRQTWYGDGPVIRDSGRDGGGEVTIGGRDGG
jgi:hypothetical protein